MRLSPFDKLRVRIMVRPVDKWGVSVARYPPNRAWLTEVRQRGPFHYRWHLNNSPMTAEPYRAKELPLHIRRSCFAPTETHLKKVGLWWRRRVLPPGPGCLLHSRLSP